MVSLLPGAFFRSSDRNTEKILHFTDLQVAQIFSVGVLISRGSEKYCIFIW